MKKWNFVALGKKHPKSLMGIYIWLYLEINWKWQYFNFCYQLHVTASVVKLLYLSILLSVDFSSVIAIITMILYVILYIFTFLTGQPLQISTYGNRESAGMYCTVVICCFSKFAQAQNLKKSLFTFLVLWKNLQSISSHKAALLPQSCIAFFCTEYTPVLSNCKSWQYL